MAVIIQIRNDVASKWTSVNPILAEGEVAIEMDTNKFKIGDGTKHWADLPYFTPGEIGDLSPLTTTQKDTIVAAINELNSDKQANITGGASTITSSNLTSNRALISNESGKVAVSSVTNAELGYLSGTTSAVQTQLNGKSSTSLDNLSANGQMIIDSQNGTISNCILDIPQDIKLDLSSNTLALKSGSVCTLVNGTQFQTVGDATYSGTTFGTGKYFVFRNASSSSLAFFAPANVVSGTTAPSTGYVAWYDTTANEIKVYNNGSDTSGRLTLPLCIVSYTNGTGVTAIDQVFNGFGYIGSYVYALPGIKGLIPAGFNSNGTYKSTLFETSSLLLHNIGTASYTKRNLIIRADNFVGSVNVYNRDTNLVGTGGWCEAGYLASTSGKITSLNIKQVRLATTEMLDKKADDLTTITGYDSTATQTLKNVNGVLTWVTD